jgi:hypothetical protein
MSDFKREKGVGKSNFSNNMHNFVNIFQDFPANHPHDLKVLDSRPDASFNMSMDSEFSCRGVLY